MQGLDAVIQTVSEIWRKNRAKFNPYNSYNFSPHYRVV